MIDKNLEGYYDIMLSIFIGVVFILVLNSFYDTPRVIIINDDKSINQ
jgi:hypothetical protein